MVATPWHIRGYLLCFHINVHSSLTFYFVSLTCCTQMNVRFWKAYINHPVKFYRHRIIRNHRVVKRRQLVKKQVLWTIESFTCKEFALTLKTFKQEIFIGIHAFIVLLISVMELLGYFYYYSGSSTNFPLNFELIPSKSQYIFLDLLCFSVFFEISFWQQITCWKMF